MEATCHRVSAQPCTRMCQEWSRAASRSESPPPRLRGDEASRESIVPPRKRAACRPAPVHHSRARAVCIAGPVLVSAQNAYLLPVAGSIAFYRSGRARAAPAPAARPAPPRGPCCVYGDRE